MSEFTELLLQNKSRKKPKPGDVFTLQVKDNLFYYGKVIKTNINSSNVLLRGWNLIFLYKYSTTCIENERLDLLSHQELLLPPVITNNKGWYDGYFLTIGNVPVSGEELSLDYGFWDDIRKNYRNEEGTVLNNEPAYAASYSLVSYGGIGRGIHRLLNNEPHYL